MTDTSLPQPTAVARQFLELLEAGDLDSAMSLLDDDIAYTNVPLPALRGRNAVERAFRPTLGRMGFRVYFHAIATDESDAGVVLTERTDGLTFGPVVVQFWVYGRFEIRDGRITVWRDSFDWGNLVNGLIRGVVGVVLPPIRRTWPSDRASA